MTNENHKTPISIRDRIRGLLMGTAAGDAIGLPAEGMPAARIMKIYKGHWRHRLLPGLGVISDDTDHTFMTAHCLLRHPQSPEGFEQELSRCLRLWLVTLPAGVGLATLRSIMRLWMGLGTSRSGVYSAGNGPAMRTAIIGAFHHNSPALMADCVRACTTITHTDPKAFTGAMAVALTAGAIVGKWGGAPPEIEAFCSLLLDIDGKDDQWTDLIGSIRQALDGAISVREFSALCRPGSKGVSGYVYHTVPVALFAWRRHHGNYRATVESVLNLGGDTDTVAAIAGALAGATTGPDAIPRKWLDRTIGWPVTIKRLDNLAEKLAFNIEDQQTPALALSFFTCMGVRNLMVLPVILLHALRRLLPPY